MIGILLAGAMLAAVPGNGFALQAGGAQATGTYDQMMSIPERPVPPIAVNGTVTMFRPGPCAVVQIAYNGPADGIEWRTIGSQCRPGRSGFRAQSQYLWGGAKPPLRLCVSRVCDTYTPRR